MRGREVLAMLICPAAISCGLHTTTVTTPQGTPGTLITCPSPEQCLGKAYEICPDGYDVYDSSRPDSGNTMRDATTAATRGEMLISCKAVWREIAPGQWGYAPPLPSDSTASAPPLGTTGTDNAVPERTGLQLALRTGYALPLGHATGVTSDDMDDFFSGQVPFLFELGGKPTPQVFVGGYFGFGVGSTSGRTDQDCARSGFSCTSGTVRGGVEVIGYASPGEKWSPWFGYGIGYESSEIRMSGPDGNSAFTLSGPEFARLMLGVDYRFSKDFGLGLFVDFSLAEFTSAAASPPGGQNQSLRIPDKGLHEWLAFGVRGVLFP